MCLNLKTEKIISMIPFVLDRMALFLPRENMLENAMFFKDQRKQEKLNKAEISYLTKGSSMARKIVLVY